MDVEAQSTAVTKPGSQQVCFPGWTSLNFQHKLTHLFTVGVTPEQHAVNVHVLRAKDLISAYLEGKL